MPHTVLGKRRFLPVASTAVGGALKTTLRRDFPNKRSHRVLEDNDPTRYKSMVGEATRRACNIQVFEILCQTVHLSD